MNPRPNAKESEKTAPKAAPFEQISAVEEKEENRMNTTLAGMEQEEKETEKAVKSNESAEEERMKKEALAELREYAQKEPAAILSKMEKEMQGELVEIESSFRKRGEKIAADLAASVMDLTFITTH